MLFGIECEFTRTFLEILLRARMTVEIACLPGPESLERPIVQRPLARANLSLMRPPGGLVTMLAHSHGIDVWRVGNLKAPATIESFRDLKADLAVVACFTRLIPRAVRSAFGLGGVNVHPSLLPDKRGPDPQFWTLKCGSGLTGVTIHRLTGRFDAGPVLAQRSLALPDGVTEQELDRRTATLGANMLIDLIPDLVTGDATAIPQDESRATYAPFPSRDDYRLDRSRPAREAFNFARGVQARGVPIAVDVNGKDVLIEEALAYWPDDPGESALSGPDQMVIAFDPGYLLVRVMSSEAD